MASSIQIPYLYGGVVHYRPGESLGERTLTDFEIVLLLEGNAQYIRDGVTHPLSPGSIVLASPTEREQYIWDKKYNTRHAYIHFQIKNIPERWGDPSTWPILRLQPNPVLPPLIRHLIERIDQHPEWPLVGPGDSTCLLLESLVSVYLEPHSSPLPHSTNRSTPVSRALNWMRTILDESPNIPISLTILAKKSGVSEKHLCRLFKQSIGHPPLKTFELLKLQLALNLLSRSNLNIKEIAQRCGFDDPLYFTRRFTAQLGCSPTKARRKMLDGEALLLTPLPADIMPRLHW